MRSEKIAEAATALTFATGVALEYISVAGLESGAFSPRAYWAIALIGAGLMFGTLLVARLYAEHIWRREDREERRTENDFGENR